jgi:hypothetical protein
MSGSTTHLPSHLAQPLAGLPQRLRDALETRPGTPWYEGGDGWW